MSIIFRFRAIMAVSALVVAAFGFSWSASAGTTGRTGVCESAPGGLPVGARVSEKIYGLAGLSNVGRISPCVFRGNQPQADGYGTLKKLGIRTVINLRAQHGERQSVEAEGMKYLEFPIGMTARVSRDTVERAVAAMADPANRPVYVHCALGQDRTGIVVAAYRMEVDGWSLSEAEKEMQSFGFNDTWIHLKKFIRHYRKSAGS